MVSRVNVNQIKKISNINCEDNFYVKKNDLADIHNIYTCNRDQTFKLKIL